MEIAERLTQRSRKVLARAEEEAGMLDQDYVGTEHILLGLIGAGEGIAAKVLKPFDITVEGVRQKSQSITDHGERPPSGDSRYTPRAEKVLQQSLREALELGNSVISPEDILLGMIREGESLAAQVLVQLGADLHGIRMQIIRELSGYERGQDEV